MMISISNRQRKCTVDREVLGKLVHRFMHHAEAMDPGKTWLECSIILVGHRMMTEINESVLKHEGTTDVITFRYRSSPGEAKGWRGEIVINVEEAIESGRDRPGGASRELALYLAHGCQHLGGADDATAVERAAMSRRQNRWLRHPEIQRLIPKLLSC